MWASQEGVARLMRTSVRNVARIMAEEAALHPMSIRASPVRRMP
jgi:hypothetical protein